ncbi:unnamed protein product [Calypogeia fissa]
MTILKILLPKANRTDISVIVVQLLLLSPLRSRRRLDYIPQPLSSLTEENPHYIALYSALVRTRIIPITSPLLCLGKENKNLFKQRRNTAPSSTLLRKFWIGRSLRSVIGGSTPRLHHDPRVDGSTISSIILATFYSSQSVSPSSSVTA